MTMKNFDWLPRRLAWVIFLIVMSAGAYGSWWLLTRQAPNLPVSTSSESAGSSLSNITLTEVDKNGKLLWEVKAKQAEYSQDRRKATIIGVTGKFFRDGKPLIEATGEGGSINQGSREITLEGKVKAIALKDNITLVTDRMVWQSDQDLLTATGNVRVEQAKKKIAITGKILKANPGANLFTIQQDVVATSVNPPLKLESPILVWDANQNKVLGQAPFRIVQTKDDVRIRADQGEWNTITHQVSLAGTVRARVPKSDIEMTTAVLYWDIGKQMLNLPKVLEIISATRGVAIAANEGQVNIATEQVSLKGQIQATSKPNQTTLKADTIEWSIPNQVVVVEGNVNYHQAEKNMNLTGNKAVANLAEQTIQVTGSDVVTQITP